MVRNTAGCLIWTCIEDYFRPANEGLLLHTHCLILYQK